MDKRNSGNKNYFSFFKNKGKNKLIFAFFLVLFIVFIAFSYFLFLKKNEKFFSFPSVSITNQNKDSLDIKEANRINIKNFGIKIEKIGVIAPIIENVNGANKNIYNLALQRGVAHLKGSALPGKGSNIFIFGHSSSNIGFGPYSKVFAKLNELERGDKIIIFYKNKEYIYLVFEKKVVEKNDLSVVKPTPKEQLTLMTCWPIGTADKRLIIKSFLVK